LGESVIYSDRFEPIYLIPIMFFRLADHYTSNAQLSKGSNSQFFLGLSSRNFIKNTHLYGSLFIDELTLEGLFESAKQKNQFGFMLGSSITDLPLDNLSMTLEYTKIFPFVYSNWLPTQTYTNSGYNMGDWIGNNADMIYAAFNYRFVRGLQASVWGEYIRKGDQGTETQEYTRPQPPFLFGKRTSYFYWGTDIKYEFIHDLFAELYYKKLSSKDLTTDLTKNSDEFYLSLYYGMK
jgi:Capsule assembly protein Wzi